MNWEKLEGRLEGNFSENSAVDYRLRIKRAVCLLKSRRSSVGDLPKKDNDDKRSEKNAGRRPVHVRIERPRAE